MRPLLHLLSVVLMLPSAVLAAAFLVLDKAIGTQSLLGVLGVLLEVFVWLLPWGLIAVLVILLTLTLCGFSLRYRWIAAACVALAAVASMAIVLALTLRAQTFDAEQLPFFFPALVAAAIGAWLAISERPRGQPALHGT